MYEFDVCIPGNSSLIIYVWDHDALTRDTLIGTAIIDIENKF